jgi:signal transduction histidine kinase
LRWRVAVAFAVTSVLITSVLGLVTWKLASNFMFDQQQQSAVGQATTDVQLVTAYLHRPEIIDAADALTGLEDDQDSTVALRVGDRWLTRGRPVDPAQLPEELLRTTLGENSPQRAIVANTPVLPVVIPIPDRQALFVELFPLANFDQALRFLRTVLLSGIALSAVMGLLLGRWAAGQALRPLRELTEAAGRVAGGDVRARLPEYGDADLAPLAATFNRTTSALEQRVARDARFAGDVSHELRSPLTTMINAVAVLDRRQDDMSGTARQALALLNADIQRFYRMVIDLLEISRDHTDTHEHDLEPCDLAELVQHALAARGETVTVVADPPHPVVLADRRRLDRVVANLLDNAAQHAGGAVSIGITQQGGRARIHVDDAGPGVPVALRQQIFERFTRGNRSGNRGHNNGTGLGLALVAEHVRRHKGTVWVEDRPGGGARFVIELPGVVSGGAR